MDKINHCINHNRFIPIDTEELSALELIGKGTEKTNELVDKSNDHEERIINNEKKKVSFDDMKEKYKFNNETDTDYRGKWFGLDEPTLSDEGMRSQVQKNRDDLIKTNEQLETIASVVLTNYKEFVKDNDWSYAFEEIFRTHWSTTTTKITIPKGEYRIARPLKLPSGGYTPLLIGEGSGTILLADLLPNEHIFYNDTNSVTGGMSIKDLVVRPYNNNYNGGFLNLQYTTRMFNLENIRIFDLDNPIILGSKVYAITNIEKVGMYNFTGRPNTIGIYTNGNTTNFLNCEVVGFKKGIVIEDISTTSFDNANVCYIKGGSYCGSGEFKIDTAIEIINGRDIKVEDVWIEGINDSVTGAKLGKSIVVRGERAKTHFNNTHISMSSVYIEGGVSEFNGTSFYQSDPSGFYVSEGATLIEKNTYSPNTPNKQYYNNNYQNIKGNIQRELSLMDKFKTSTYNILPNNRLIVGRGLPIAATNANQTIEVDGNDYVSGENSYKVTNTASQGVVVNCNVDKNELYTVIARVKNIGNLNVFMSATSPTQPTDMFPYRTTKSGTWTLIYGVYKSTTNTLTVKIIGDGGGAFNIDSVSVFKGYNISAPCGVELDDKLYLAKNRIEFLDVFNSPETATSANTRTWNRGDIIYPIYPQSGKHKGWTCVTGGTPGVWIGHGVL